MKASFDGARKWLISDFNRLAKTELSDEQRMLMSDLRSAVVSLACMSCPKCDDDCNEIDGPIADVEWEG